MITYYTFYDSSGENLICSGTAQNLVDRRYFKSRFAVELTASKIKRGIDKSRFVVIEKISNNDFLGGGPDDGDNPRIDEGF